MHPTRLFWLPALVAFGCQVGGPEVSRVALGLTGQFLPGELTRLEIEVYDGTAASCVEGRRVEGDLGTPVEARRDISLPAEPVELSLDQGAYVVRVRAGRPADFAPGGRALASGCASVELGSGDSADLVIPLHRADRCGDGVLDLAEQCDDGGRAPGDGCDEGCRTEHALANTVVDSDQYAPIAAGEGNLFAVCWRSTHRTLKQAPLRKFDRFGEPLGAEVFQTGSDTMDCTDVDVSAGAVLLAFLRGAADPRWPSLTMWTADGTQQTRGQAGEYGDIDVAASFLAPMEAVVVSERSRSAGSPHELWLRRMRAEGGAVVADGLEVAVDETGTALEAAQAYPAVAGGADGQVLVVWLGALGRIWARLFDGSGNPGELLRLYEGAGRCGPPSVARLSGSGEHRYVVVFPEGEFGFVAARLVTAEGATSDLLRVSEREHARMSAVAALGDRALVVWVESRASGSDVFARVLDGTDAEGEPLFGHLATGSGVTDSSVLVSPDLDGEHDEPSVATSSGTAEGTALVVYRDRTDGAGDDIGRRVLRLVRPPAE